MAVWSLGAVLLLGTGVQTLQAQDNDRVFYFPHLAVGARWQTTITYINYSPGEVTCQTDFLSNDGSPLVVSFAGLGRVVSRTDVLPPGGSVHEETNVDLNAPLAPGWARANCSGPVKASLLFRRYNSDGVPVAEAGVNATTVPATRFVTFAEQGEGRFGTGVAYANPSATAAVVTFTARDAAGQTLASVNHNLPPRGHGAQNMVHLFGLTGFTGSLEVTSTEPIVSLSLNFEADPVFSSLPPGELDTSSHGSTTYYFPHLAVGAGWQTTITYINYSPGEVTCQTDFLSDDGSRLMVSFTDLGSVVSRTDVLPPEGAVRQETNAGRSTPLAPGWARAHCSGPVKASLLFRRYDSEGVPTGEAGVNAAAVPATRFVTFAEQGEGWFGTGVAYANPSATAAVVTFTARDAAGQTLASVNHNLPPRGHGAQNMVHLFGLTSFSGSIQVTSTEPIVSLSLNFEADPVFSSLPPGETVDPPPYSGGNPDLTVYSIVAFTNPSGTPPGGSFSLSAGVRNVGDGDSAATTLRYYRSTDATIMTSDTVVGTDGVAGLAASAISSESVQLTAPSTAGTYYYGACVGAVVDESDTTNNCSRSVSIAVEEPDLQAQTIPLWVTFDPPMLRADYTGELSLELLVAGDVEALFFVPFSGTPFRLSTLESWRRAVTEDFEGHLVSVFRQTLDSSYLRFFLSRRRGFFNAEPLFVGRIFLDRPESSRARPDFFLKIQSLPVNTPRSQVRRISDTVQYASHVVNLMVPSFGNSRFEGMNLTFLGRDDMQAATQKFYEHFTDDYDSLAIIPAEQHIPPLGSHTVGGGIHSHVRNPVQGLGRYVDDSSLAMQLGSGGRLRGIEHFISVADISNPNLVIHEIAHNWWDFWDWNGLTGLSGMTDGSHGPDLRFPNGGFGGRTIRQLDGGEGFVIEDLPPNQWGYVRLADPTILYRMGLIGPEDVPESVVFENQGQWRSLKHGDRIEGGYRSVHISDIITRHGPRIGPVDSLWRMATLIVSRDRLLSEDEMSYLNYVVARQEQKTGPPGYPSYYQSSDGKARLYTDITPKFMPKIVNDPPLPPSEPPIDRREFPGVLLDEPLQRTIHAGDMVTVSGLITDPEMGHIETICASWNRMKRDGGYASRVKRKCATVTGGKFSADFEFRSHDAGIYSFSLYSGNTRLEWWGYRYWPGEITGIEVVDQGTERNGSAGTARSR